MKEEIRAKMDEYAHTLATKPEPLTVTEYETLYKHLNLVCFEEEQAAKAEAARKAEQERPEQMKQMLEMLAAVMTQPQNS